MPRTPPVATCTAQEEPTSSRSSLWQSLPGSPGEASPAGVLLRSLPHWAPPSVPGEVRVLGCGGGGARGLPGAARGGGGAFSPGRGGAGGEVSPGKVLQIKYSFLLLSPLSWRDGSSCRAASALSANSVPLASLVW